MSLLFEPIAIGNLQLRNRIMRSATAEWLADKESGAPLPQLGGMYRELAEGGVALIVTGHACVAYSGRTNEHMTAMGSDELVPAWRDVIRPAQEAGARVMIQINHGGANVDGRVVDQALSPSGVATNDLARPRALSGDEVLELADAFGQAARRAREAGFDGVEIHGAHGYLISQFLSPLTNRRQDAWGGDLQARRRFLQAVYQRVRQAVGPDYPVWIKLGVAGRRESGLSIAEGAQVAAACFEYGIECVEISHALGQPEELDMRLEAPYLPMAQAVRRAVGPDRPLALVSGFRTRGKMHEVLDSGVVQMISLCRPLIAEPDLPDKLRDGLTDEAACTRCDLCRPGASGEPIACQNPRVLESLS